MQPTSSRKNWGWRRLDRLDKILFFCYVRTFTPTEDQVLWHEAAQLWAFTALHPPAAGGFITLLSQPRRAESCYQQPCWAHDWAASPCCKQMVQKEKRSKKKVPTGRVCCFHRAGDSRERLDYNPCYVFISALVTRCCSPWLSWLSSTAARFIIPSPGKTLPPSKQTHENDAAVTGFQC